MAAEIGRTPMWVMKNFTHPQLVLFYGKMKKKEFDYIELQARLVWAVANGWKKPKQVSADDIAGLKGAAGGMIQES